jgi:hypothetical protein
LYIIFSFKRNVLTRTFFYTSLVLSINMERITRRYGSIDFGDHNTGIPVLSTILVSTILVYKFYTSIVPVLWLGNIIWNKYIRYEHKCLFRSEPFCSIRFTVKLLLADLFIANMTWSVMLDQMLRNIRGNHTRDLIITN